MKLDLGPIPHKGKGYFFINPEITSIEPDPDSIPRYADNYTYSPYDTINFDTIIQISNPKNYIVFDFEKIELDKDDVLDARLAAEKFFEVPKNLEYATFLDYVWVEKIVVNLPATVALWSDGDKTVLKLHKGDRHDFEKSVALLYLKKFAKDFGISFHRILKDADFLVKMFGTADKFDFEKGIALLYLKKLAEMSEVDFDGIFEEAKKLAEIHKGFAPWTTGEMTFDLVDDKDNSITNFLRFWGLRTTEGEE